MSSIEVAVRRARHSGTAARGESTVSQTIELYDFGTDVEVEIPPEDEVLDGRGWRRRRPEALP